jgi:ParB/RepB/Spo0J family partition protein
MQYKEIEVEKIKTRYNSRSIIRKDDLASLMLNIRENGLLQPVGVVAKNGEYELIFGNRRVKAFKMLGIKTIPAIISEKEISEMDAILKNAAENIIRKELSPIELGKIALDLKEKFNMSDGEIAAALSVPTRRIKLAIVIIQKAPKHIQDMIGYYNTGMSRSNRKGKVPPSIINSIYSSKINKDQMNELVEYCKKSESIGLKITQIIETIKNGLSVKEAIKATEDFQFVNLHMIADKEEIKKIKKNHASLARYIALIIEGKLPSHEGLFYIKEESK